MYYLRFGSILPEFEHYHLVIYTFCQSQPQRTKLKY
jgi:hypothetical protein